MQVAGKGRTMGRWEVAYNDNGPKPYPIPSSDVKSFHRVPNAACKLDGCYRGNIYFLCEHGAQSNEIKKRPVWRT